MPEILATARGRSAPETLAATGRDTVYDAIRAVVGAHDVPGFTAYHVSCMPESVVWKLDGTRAPYPAHTVVWLRGQCPETGARGHLLRVVEADGTESHRAGPFATPLELDAAAREASRLRIALAKQIP